MSKILNIRSFLVIFLFYLNLNVFSLKESKFKEKLTKTVPKKDKNYWEFSIKEFDLKHLKTLKIELSNEDLVKTIKTLKSVDYYEKIKFLLSFVKFDENIQNDLLVFILSCLTTPENEQQKNIQFEIVRFLANKKSKLIKTTFLTNFNLIIQTLNIPLIAFIINDYEININKLVQGRTNLNWVIINLINYPTNNINLVYETFTYLLINGADIKQENYLGADIFELIMYIKTPTISQTFIDILLKFQ